MLSPDLSPDLLRSEKYGLNWFHTPETQLSEYGKTSID